MVSRYGPMSVLLGVAILSMFRENSSLTGYQQSTSEMDLQSQVEELERENHSLLKELLELKKKYGEEEIIRAPPEVSRLESQEVDWKSKDVGSGELEDDDDNENEDKQNEQRDEEPTDQSAAPITKPSFMEPFNLTTRAGHRLRLEFIPPDVGRIMKTARNATEERPFIAESLYHYGNFSVVPSIVKRGQAVPYFPEGADQNDPDQMVWPARNQSEAVCILRTTWEHPITCSDEYPHNMQQLLRCFSWWSLNAHQRPVLQMARVTQTPVIREYYKAMTDVFGVRVEVRADTNNSAPAVDVEFPHRNLEHTIETYVMNSPDAVVFTEKMLQHFLPDTPTAGCGKSKQPVIALLNREGTRRRLSNHNETLQALLDAGFQVQYKRNFDHMTLADQMKFMAQADIVVGPHGAQFTNTLYQPKCGSLIELFGEKYYLPNFFGSLARLSGKHHFVYYPGGYPRPRKYRVTKMYSVMPEVVVQMVQKAVEKWHSCCEHGFQ